MLMHNEILQVRDIQVILNEKQQVGIAIIIIWMLTTLGY